MSDASTNQSVECPICGDEFDPTVAGGWCTNTECGEWQYTEESTESGTTDNGSPEPADPEADDGELVAPDQADEGADPVDLFEESGGDDDAETGADGVDDAVDDPEEDVDVAEEAAAEDVGEEEAVADDVADGTETDDADGAAVDDTEEDDAADEDGPGAVDAGGADDTEAAGEGADESADEVEADTIDCPDCGVTLDADVNFCAECGTDVSDVSPGEAELDACPACGTDVEPEDNFCVNCGEDLDAHRGSDSGTPETNTDDGSETVPESLVLEIEGREIHVDDGDTVGREIRAALTDAGRPDDEAVRIHREHVRFVRESDSFYLLDLGDNPTQLNGATLQKGDREPVAPGDELELSGVASVTVGTP
ncbi:zinc ribbon domain-containing protein [Haloarcula sediminis]|uniref:zinc ribbon domain-containing protein n=1 Tax=Haloarcula sediminis TaxID=3111777 RepID=UPI002D790E33|nr:zinc ribbon domain-containing protein [Haloarcula sp. CK38]